MEALRIALDTSRYHQNGFAMAYWACAGLVFTHALLISPDGSAVDPRRRAVAPLYGAMGLTMVVIGLGVASGDHQQTIACGRVSTAVATLLSPAVLRFVTIFAGPTRRRRLIVLGAAI